MSLYRIEWTETWLRTITADLDEDSLRAFADVTVGPIPESLIKTYLEESVCGEYEQWHPGTAPGFAYENGDEYNDLTIDDIFAPNGLDEFTRCAS